MRWSNFLLLSLSRALSIDFSTLRLEISPHNDSFLGLTASIINDLYVEPHAILNEMSALVYHTFVGFPFRLCYFFVY